MSKICQLLGVKPMSGNKVSHSNRKTKRRFLPNLKLVTFFSDCLQSNLKIRIATSTLRTVNKYGSIDSFLVNYRFNKLTEFAQNLRVKVKRKLIATNNIEQVLVSQPAKPKFVSARKKLKTRS